MYCKNLSTNFIHALSHVTSDYLIMLWLCFNSTYVVRIITQNSIEVDAETKESTKKTEEKLDGRYKEGHERKKPK